MKSFIAHWRYLKYVLRHKYYVFIAGRKVRVSLWQLLVHDWSKFSRAEWTPYVKFFYTANGSKYDFNKAWLHHQHRNPHHWQHWLLQEDDGDCLILVMPEKYAREMVADWAGAGRAITGRWEIAKWYQNNFIKIKLQPQTRRLVEQLIEENW